MTMPQRGESGQPWETGPQPAAGQPGAGQPGAGQPGAAGQPYPPGPPGYPAGSQQFGNAPQGAPGGYGGAMGGQPISPVNEIETRVTGRRIVQYIVDAILFGIVVALVSWALNRGHGGIHALLYIILIVVDVVWYALYWAAWPFSHRGQTVGMQLMELRVIGMDGGVASFMQLFVRSILLVLFTPLSLIVGIITMMFSRYRQRVGDHMARTMVVRSSVEPLGAAQEYAGAGQAGSR
jgi:uncharacterized RDD family membrane protein YckC